MLSNGIHIGLRGGVRLTGGGGETPWWLAGGISAGNVVAVYQPKGAASLAASYVNLANPGTYDAAPGVAPTFDTATGWTFNGSTQYLTTGIVPVNNQTWTIMVRFSDAPAAGTFQSIAGLGWAGGQGFMLAITTATSRRSYYSGSLVHVGILTQNGVMAIAGNQGYYNGVANGATISAAAFTNTFALVIGALNQANSIVSFFNGKIQAAFVASSTLTAGQVAALSTAMAAL